MQEGFWTFRFESPKNDMMREGADTDERDQTEAGWRKAENSGCRPCSQGRGESGVAASQRGGAGRGKAGCWREGRSIFRCGGYWGKRRG